MTLSLRVAADVVFGFGFDVVKSATTASGFSPAAEHLGSDEPLYGLPRLEGFAAMLHLNFTRRLIIPGKAERRYKNERIAVNGRPTLIWQGYAIKQMLIEDCKCDPLQVEWIKSNSSTNNAAAAIRAYAAEKGISFIDGRVEFVTSWYHCVRTSRVALRDHGLPSNITPAESFTIARSEILGARKKEEDRLRSFGGHYADDRVIAEIGGIADHLLGRYTSKTKGW